jgi:hypothetical protein
MGSVWQEVSQNEYVGKALYKHILGSDMRGYHQQRSGKETTPGISFAIINCSSICKPRLVCLELQTTFSAPGTASHV